MRSKHTSTSLRIALGASIVLHLTIFIVTPAIEQKQHATSGPLEVSIQAIDPEVVREPIDEIAAPLANPRLMEESKHGKTPRTVNAAESESTNAVSNTTDNSALDLSRDALIVAPAYIGPSAREDELLAFRPLYKEALRSRNIAKERTKRIALNLAQRNGYRAELFIESEQRTQAFDTITKVGTSCYSDITSSLPSLSINRGNRVREVECPGYRSWWGRDDLNDLALNRNGYN